MVSEQPLILVPVSFALTAALDFMLLKVSSRWRLVATPNARSSHIEPTPTAGGFAIAITLILYLFSKSEDPFTLSLAAGCLVLAAIGLWDDVNESSRSLRLLLQLAVVSVILFVADLDTTPLTLGIVTVLIVWHINLFNFMDGIDGIAGTQVLLFAVGVLLIQSGSPDWLVSTLWITIGSTAGFLLFNWPPARMFMGDAGSLLLGFLLAVFTLELSRTQAMPLSACLILLSGFWVDATYTLSVRVLTRQNPFKSHRIHLYQKLAQRFGHRSVTLGFMLYGGIWLVPLAAVAAYHRNLEWLAMTAAVVPVAVLAVVMKAGVERQLEQHR